MPSAAVTDLLSPELLKRLERLELVSRRIFRGRLKGERRGKRKGQSVEFADFRSYIAGDDLRFIDWNLYARLDKLFLKLFLEEEDLHVFALIDASESMNFGTPTKLHVAKQLAAALGYVGLCRADRVKVAALGPPSAAAPVLRGRASMWRMIDYLSGVEPGHNVSLSSGVKDFCLRNPGQGVVLLITDLMDKDGYESALRMLVGRRMDVYLLHVMAPEELDPPLIGDLKLVDAEDGEETEVTASGYLLNRYRRGVDSFVAGARSFCSQRGVTYIQIRSDEPVERIVTSYLRSHGVVR
ncbi:DUF58 domain-containing protein [Candidatus Laterigemmans baculatus]|uniref:DUF58 domain-containing protein n=1 Tax=Candidatus Laterigemmans baculatus TaxID=2770505 RepID=UPI0013DD388F|nr:DUF58 domain-containing protein [Candidatus Laterigemmans baculatus]